MCYLTSCNAYAQLNDSKILQGQGDVLFSEPFYGFVRPCATAGVILATHASMRGVAYRSVTGQWVQISSTHCNGEEDNLLTLCRDREKLAGLKRALAKQEVHEYWMK
ncbi:uncharacterized protein LOC107273919 [Cephus cinctus]|uniref:Uncharacterized protein LOC107273919 n=1 Tax=Cephus cinctus TaxID=211228 RepID=A0AAJ7CDD1_CEPCN|nr:uncharacterized protein LOC107273919 [Cephus cinctus]